MDVHACCVLYYSMFTREEKEVCDFAYKNWFLANVQIPETIVRSYDLLAV